MVCLNFDVLQVGVRMFRKVVKFLRREPKMTDDSSVTVKMGICQDTKELGGSQSFNA